MGAWLKQNVGGYSPLVHGESLASLVREHAHSFSEQRATQVAVWEQTLELTKRLCELFLRERSETRTWTILYEFEIPRRRKRPDLVLLAGDVIFVIELKFGARDFDSAARWQVEEYALDLRDFHAGSSGRRIVPVLVATEAAVWRQQDSGEIPSAGTSFALPVQCTGAQDLGRCILELYDLLHESHLSPLDVDVYDSAPYRPVLSIIEAAEELFAGHSVREISHAYADNLRGTVDALLESIELARSRRERVICFVTGVPGSGKTLAGLSAVHDPSIRGADRPPGIFLSGNGPLVKILIAALARDAAHREGAAKKVARREASAFIQNVHAFIEEHAFKSPHLAPPEQVVIFDEAQRAWDQQQIDKKRRSQGKAMAARSEAGLILDIMERSPEWSVIIALVGGGQEIHTGEAGLAEWGRALGAREVSWKVFASPQVLPGSAPRPGGRLLDRVADGLLPITPEPRLHLGVSVRSPRAQHLSDWVDAMLDGRSDDAHQRLRGLREFPIVLTRDLDQTRRWLRARAGSDRRCGLLASSGARRHRAYGIELSSEFRHGYPYEDWFLEGLSDVRSSCQLEVAATQFECQGLELDWVGLCWGGDLTYQGSSTSWSFRRFTGSSWKRVNGEEERSFLLNRYRVLLTRARYGMLIWVPPGNALDATLDPLRFDETHAYLQACGVPILEPF
jgi:hypothetical protein